jgi:hypothetical protein
MQVAVVTLPCSVRGLQNEWYWSLRKLLGCLISENHVDSYHLQVVGMDSCTRLLAGPSESPAVHQSPGR